MPIEHAETRWSEWLKQVSAARGANVKVIGQPLEDLLRGTVAIANLEHLAEPLDWITAGASFTSVGVAAEFGRVELVCVRASWVSGILVTADTMIEILDVPLIVTAAPPTIFSGVPVNTVGVESDAQAPAADSYLLNPGVGAPVLNMEFFVPRGKVFSLTDPVANHVTLHSIRWREIPETR